MLLLYLRMDSGDPQLFVDLHSTMLLLYPNTPYADMSRLLPIYIPLCFYFIIDACVGFFTRLIFTFHYASTLSHTGGRWFWVHYLFTFHYASTLSLQNITQSLGFYHLHSTMLLLYPNEYSIVPVSWYGFTFHYASTLSFSSFARLHFFSLFTFHYASTLSTSWSVYRSTRS